MIVINQLFFAEFSGINQVCHFYFDEIYSCRIITHIKNITFCHIINIGHFYSHGIKYLNMADVTNEI